MPNELTIPAVQPTSPTGPRGHPPTPPVPTAPGPVQPYTNPSLRLDPGLGLVVIEFRNDAGAVTRSIPSKQQIEAYRTHEQTPPGPDGKTPAGKTPDATAPDGKAPDGKANDATAGREQPP